MRNRFNVLWIAAVVLLVAAPSRGGDLVTVGTYQNKGVETRLLTYTEGKVVVGLIGMKQSGTSVSFAFAHGDWPDLQKLWQAAIQATGSEYKAVGSLPESGTKAKCVITAAGGPTVRLTIVDPVDGAIQFDVPDVQDFDAKLKQVAAATTD